MSFKQFSISVCAISFAALLLMLVLIHQIVHLQDEIKGSEVNQYQSINLAKELFKSSEDLSKFARSYVVTGNPVFKERFRAVEGIREGTVMRPYHYGPTYWYLNGRTDAGSATGRSISLQTLMKTSGFTEEELKMLYLSQMRSNELIQLEEKAFLAIEGQLDTRLADGMTSRNYAMDLLFGEDYELAKYEIMVPIRQVINSVEKRTTDQLKLLQQQMDTKLRLLWLLIVIVLVFIAFVFIYAAKKFVTPLKHLSEVDPLTKLYNRRSFYDQTKRVFNFFKSDHAYTLMLVDIDCFKVINDTYGHDVGDLVLKKFSLLLKAEFREKDVISRWGGEEFIVLIPKTRAEHSESIAERLRRLVDNYRLEIEDDTVSFTISIGLITGTLAQANIDESIKLADVALYEAKTSGRNKVVSYSFEERSNIG